MNLISISTDRKIFETGSVVAGRMKEYGTLVGQQHIVVFTRKGGVPFRLSANTWVYPTNSSSKFFYIRDARRLAATIVRTNSFSSKDTIVSVQDPFETGLVGTFLKKKFGLKLQMQIHTDFLSPYFVAHSFLNRLRVWIAHRTLPHADQVRVVSRRIQDSLMHRFPVLQSKTVSVLPIYTDVSRFDVPPRFDARKKYPQFSTLVLMCSRLTPEKNIPFALRVFKDVLKDFPSTGLIIVGDGPDKNQLRQLVNMLGISASVVFEAWTDDVISYYKTVDIFLSTSLYEGYGLTLIEAGLASLPVVASTVGIVGDVLVDGKSMRACPVNDHVAFVDALKSLIASPAERERLGHAAHASLTAGVLSKDRYLQEYKKLLELTRHEDTSQKHE